MVNVLLVGLPFIIYTAYKFFTKPSTPPNNSNLPPSLEIQEAAKKNDLLQSSSEDIKNLNDKRSNPFSMTPSNFIPTQSNPSTPENNPFTRLPIPTTQEELNRRLATPIMEFSPPSLLTEIEKPAASSWRDQLVTADAQSLSTTIVQLGRDICGKCPEETGTALPNSRAFAKDFSFGTNPITVEFVVDFLGIENLKLRSIKHSFENIQRDAKGSAHQPLHDAIQQFQRILEQEVHQEMLKERCSAKWDLRCPRVEVGVRILTKYCSWYLSKSVGLDLQGAWGKDDKDAEDTWNQQVGDWNKRSGFSDTDSRPKTTYPVGQ